MRTGRALSRLGAGAGPMCGVTGGQIPQWVCPQTGSPSAGLECLEGQGAITAPEQAGAVVGEMAVRPCNPTPFPPARELPLAL